MTLTRFYLLLCVTFWGWAFVASKVCLRYVDPVELLGLRFLIGVPALLLVVLLKRLRFNFTAAERRSVLMGSAIITAHFLIQLTGISYTSATNTGWLIAVTPLVMAVLAFLILKERIGRKGVMGIALATTGIVLLVSRGNLGSLEWISSVGDWLVLLSAHTWALYTIVIRDVTRARNPLAVTFAVLVPSSVVVLGYMLFVADWSAFLDLPTDFVLALLFLALPGLAVAHWFWQEGVARVGAARAGMYLYLEPLATTAMAVPFLNEEFGFFTGFGGLLVLVGVYWAQRNVR